MAPARRCAHFHLLHLMQAWSARRDSPPDVPPYAAMLLQ